jgi:hypothetical protein
MADLTEQQLMSQDPELMGLQYKRQLANLLTGQGLNQPQGQMISGHYVKPSALQSALPMIQAAIGGLTNANLDTEQAKYAQKLRELGVLEAQNIMQAQKGTPAGTYPAQAGPMPNGGNIPIQEKAAVPGSNMAAFAEALRGRTPISQNMAQVLQKQLLESPDWKEGKLEQPDGSVITGWYNPKAPNPLSTFIQGGTKPAYTPMEAAKYTYETGMQPPGALPNKPIQGAPVQNAPVQGASAPMSNRVAAAPSAMPVSYQAGNQPITATGNTVPVSAMNRPGMSPKDLSEANKQVYAKSEEQRQADLRALPASIEQANMAIKTIDEMIGDARLNDKGEIVYQKYDPTSKKYVEGKTPHAGFENYVGATWLPGMRFMEGSDAASFEPLYKAIKGQAFLQAFERLKGGGQITEVEGQKATEALLKLDKAQNEKDFVKYAREFQENLQKGMELAKNKAGVSKEYRSPVGQPALRWNPQTNSWVNQ